MLGLSFRISPDAFFQVNTLGAESLLTLLRAQCSLGPDSVLLYVLYLGCVSAVSRPSLGYLSPAGAARRLLRHGRHRAGEVTRDWPR